MTKLATFLHLARSISTCQASNSPPPAGTTLVDLATLSFQFTECKQGRDLRHFMFKTLKNNRFVGETIRFLRSLVGYF